MAEGVPLVIATYRDAHQARFAELNRAWLVQFNLLEPADEAQLRDPRVHFQAHGGEVFVAQRGGTVVGTAAVVPHGAPDEWEIAKLAVDPTERGRGLGRQLVERCIEFAASHGATRMTLVSNHQLAGAIRIYESLGFEHRPLPRTEYETADVYMELELGDTKRR